MEHNKETSGSDELVEKVDEVQTDTHIESVDKLDGEYSGEFITSEKLSVKGAAEDPVGSVAPGEEGELSPKEEYNVAAQTIEFAAKDLEISHTVHSVRNSTYSKDRKGTRNAAYEKLGRVLAECYGLELRESSDKGITTFTFVGK